MARGVLKKNGKKLLLMFMFMIILTSGLFSHYRKLFYPCAYVNILMLVAIVKSRVKPFLKFTEKQKESLGLHLKKGRNRGHLNHNKQLSNPP